jgi:hypothetical protein
MNQNENKSGPSLVTSPNQNPNRKLTTSPERNPANHRRYVTNENGRSPRAKSEHKRRRTTGSGSVSGHGHGGEGEYFPDEQGEYYSGLEDSSDEGSGSDSDDESGSGLEDLDLGEDDIPVTGFAVASNKRNADFHELFPGIPEGDYLIDGALAYLSFPLNLNLIFISRLWMRSPKGDLDPRTNLCFRKPPLLPRQHLWLGY